MEKSNLKCNSKIKGNSNVGITLIALVISIIVLLILAGVSISVLSGDNGILTRATEAKVKTDIAGLKEQVKMAVVSYQADNIHNTKKLTVSEIIDKLKDDNIIDNNMIFIQNNNYKFSYNGYIKDMGGEIVENVKLTDNIISMEITADTVNSNITGTRIIKCVDGSIEKKADDRFKLTSTQIPPGYKFGYWIDKYDNIVSYSDRQMAYSTYIDNTYTAIYVKNNTNISPQVCINAYPTNEGKDGFLGFQMFFNFPAELGVSSFIIGCLGTSNGQIANDVDLVINTTYTGSDLYKKVNAYSGGMDGAYGVYRWVKSNVGTSTWYVRGYLTLNYENGTSQTFYSPSIVSAHR